MATELDTKPAVPKYEAFVDSQLARVRARIRALEAGRSLLALGVVTLGYFLIMALFDLAVHGADDGLEIAVRFAAFAAYVVIILGLLVQLGLRLYRRINPFYAAKQLEDTIADAKNSVINWLDLRERELPGAIRGAVGQRAARELKQTDPDRAVNPKSNWVLGSVCAGLALGLLILFALGPNQFGSLFRRAFAPFVGSGLGTRTEITLLKPLAGNATVPLNQRVEFEARIEGRFPKIGQPDAPRLFYRYQAADPYVPLPLDENPDGNWGATLNSDQVLNGLWYKIAAGDTETPEYQIKVQSVPHVQRFEITYHYRPYRKLTDDKVVFPNEQAVIPRLIDYRGTEVDLVVRTNRLLRQASLELDMGGTKSEVPGDILLDDPKAMHVRMKLEQRGTFRVLFTSNDGERNTDRSAYQIEVLDDQTPRVLLSKPGKDIALPANGTLQLEGSATDDIGLTSLVLRLRVLDGTSKPALAPKPYRDGKSFQFDNGTYPDFIDYKDFLPLDKLTTAKGEPFPLKAGTILEYWLEATDNSDYPSAHGNIGKSAASKVTITDPAPDQKKQQ
jgi:collagen type III alpha